MGTTDRASAEVIHGARRAPCTVAYVADFYRSYPGEEVTLYSRVTVREPVPGFRLRIALPRGLVAGATRAPDGAVPQLALEDGASQLLWTVRGEMEAGTHYEVQLQAQVAPTQQDRVLKSRAVVTAEGADGQPLASDEERLTLAVSAKARSLHYLPALYDQDELMGRFLMLFESFWNPLEGQIEQLPLYFDPRFTPPAFLPWLASWFDLLLDERWPEERRRELLRCVAALYRQRGTRQGLQRYLELFTGETPQIIEHRAHNFVLGDQCRLGPSVALGTSNVPHAFTVILRLPPPATREGDEARQELERRRVIETIIEEQKPAHASYTLQIEPLTAVGRREQAARPSVDQMEG